MNIDRTQYLGRASAMVAVATGLAIGLFAAGEPTHRLAAAQKDLVPDKAPIPKDINAAVAECRICHSGKDAKGARDFVKRYASHQFIRLDESITWDEKDVHSLAYRAIDGKLGKEMGARLGYKGEPAKGSDWNNCLTCHAVDLTPAASVSAKSFYRDDGVSCNACHGLAYEWQKAHTRPAPEGGTDLPWRALTPDAKRAAGMADLRNPVAKAQLCASCHVGDPAAGKVVTHDMYAAGHPPLPPLELATYMESQPRHWGYPVDPELTFFTTDDRAKEIKEKENWTWTYFRFHPSAKERYLTRHFVAGAVASLEAEVQLLRADAMGDKSRDGTDFARFDCYACHHDLKYPSDRQQRGYDGFPPGRPSIRIWTGALVQLVADHAKGIETGGLNALGGAFKAKWDALRAAVLTRPFGDPKLLPSATEGMIEWCRTFSKVQRDTPQPIYDDLQAKRLTEMIHAAADRWASDPEAAMCLTWAYVALRRDLGSPLTNDQLAELGKQVPVAVRSEPYDRAQSGERVPVPARYPERASRVNAFSADPFRAAFKLLRSP